MFTNCDPDWFKYCSMNVFEVDHKPSPKTPSTLATSNRRLGCKTIPIGKFIGGLISV